MPDRPSGHATRRALVAAALAAPLAGLLPRLPAAAQSAEDLLRAGAEAMAGVQSFHFTLTTPLGRTSVLNALTLRAIEGDVLRPDRFRAHIDATAAGLMNVSISVVGIGPRLWISDPRTGGATWIETGGNGGNGGPGGPGGPDAGADSGSGSGSGSGSETDSGAGDVIALLANPDLIFLSALAVLSAPTVGPDGAIDGEPVRRVDGVVDLRALADASTSPGGSSLPPDLIPEPLPASIWFDAASRPRRIEIEGAILPGEDAAVIRRLDLTAFDAPVTIEPPSNATPLASAG